jgi:hypothetical protein
MLERRAPKVWGAEISELPATIHFHVSFLAVLDHPINAIPDVLGCTPRSVSVVRKFGLKPYERIIQEVGYNKPLFPAIRP